MTLWTVFCWEPLGPIIHMEVTLTSYTFSWKLFTNSSGLFQQYNVTCQKVKKGQE